MSRNTPELDKLFEEVGTYRSSKDYFELMNFIKRFPKMAPYNAMLVHIQKPGSIYVASASEWVKRFNRKPKPGARPLVILRTFGPVEFVYELNDTQGDSLPKEVENPFKAEGIINEGDFKRIIKNLYFDGISVSRENFGTQLAGFVKVLNGIGYYEVESPKKHLEKPTKYEKMKLPFAIVINNKLDITTQLASIYHEIGHIYCGHLYNPEIKYLPERYSSIVQIKEFEAESVSWLLCERQGIKNPSAEYLSYYIDNNHNIPDISLDAVLKAVAKIERLINTELKKPREELLIGSNEN